MKKILLSTLIGILFYSCSSTKDTTKYYNLDNIEISKSKFNRLRMKTGLLAVYNDSLNGNILVNRESSGQLKNLNTFNHLLKNELNINNEHSKPIVIIYYFDKDIYNSWGGFVNEEWMKNWKTQLENGLNKVAGIKPIYLYQNFDGLKTHEGIIPWKKDPRNEIGQLFFKYKYPWLSFVVISKDGKYMSVFGEFPIEYVIKATYLMNH